jgi:folate-binding protein YgfZ
MANPSPLDERFEQADAEFLAFGADVRLVAMHDMVETEYGRLRNRAAIMDCPHRGLVKITGSERLAFLHRMLTNDCEGLPPGRANRHFLLTAKGRIIADLLLLHEPDATWVDLDLPNVSPFIEEMDMLLFGEDVVFEDISRAHHRFSVHGKAAREAIDDRSAATFDDLEPDTHRRVTVAGVEGLCYRRDDCGVAGYHLWVPGDRALQLWSQFRPTDAEGQPAEGAVKPLGWLAYNIARIEAGTPLFHVDFGPDCLPGETGLADQTLSATKGCYRGQEVVARMRDLGHPSKQLVGFAAESDAVPVAGSPVLDGDGPEAATIGAITSSAPSPMLSNRPIGLAMVKWGCHEPGTVLHTPAGGATVPLEVRDTPFI